MPEWAETLLGVVAGGLLVLLAQWLNFYFQRYRAREQRVLDLYAEFVGVVSDDLERAKSVESALLFKPNTKDDDFERWLASYAKLEDRRHHHRVQMFRLSLQIRVLEQDQTLCTRVDEVCKGQPVFNRLGGWEGDHFHRQLDKHKSEIASYTDRVDSLCREVHKKYRR